MYGNIFHDPISAHPGRILDVGCGTGVTTLELAQKYPGADVYGVDLSAAFTAVTDSHPRLDNLHFVQGDIGELINAQKAPFSPGNFDYVFSRLLILGVADWPAHIAVLSGLLAKNGSIELQEVTLDAYSPSSPTEPLTWSFLKALQQDYAAVGLDFNAGSHLSARMKATPGLADVHAQRYRVMCTMEGATQAEQRLAEYMNGTLVPFLGLMFDTLPAKAGRGEGERRRLKEDVALRHENFEAGTHMEFWVAWARKA
ncbi:S-adenosyl-L-methionine-dependent methyltransferase [Teratosphaeria destructans]|uniref:S-adenosyl-L-methionine-dependent methyltransferase n=1 Tax=Teratosphaeria destructans TaxID=418781 RepID=A0A9W7W1D4_9PEZI|nr:S-adenosyl-L-methionine-dependent methyltransferase [Teratosphaeria destructans]